MDFVEGVGESSSPPRNGTDVIRISEVYNRLIENGNEEAVNNPHLREQLAAHFRSLPSSYVVDVNLDRVEDVLLHQKLLERAKDPKNRPAFHIRLLEIVSSGTSGADDSDEQEVSSALRVSDSHDVINSDNDQLPSQRNCSGDPETCSKLEDLNLDVRKISGEMSRVNPEPEAEAAVRQEASDLISHEIIFSTADKPKLLSQLSALLSDIGLNIREAHVFSTTDGYSLDVFVVDGWEDEDTESLYDALREAISGSEGTWSGHSNTQTVWDKTIAAQTSCEGWEIDWRFLKVGGKIAGGACGDLYRGEYRGQDVAIKILKSEHLTQSVQVEFSQEVAILRQVQHENVVSFVGACTKLPHLCIVTEYMPGGSLYDYLHKNKHVLKLQQYLKFAIDVCKGMEYLHQKNIIHRDLKTANLLLDNLMVVKVADFGIARFQTSGEVMTAETGTYRWMAPEVISHEPYNQKADIFSFAIVLWELITAKIPYATMTPVQAAVGVRQGCRPELPKNTHPKLLDLMQRCWDQVPSNRPSFSEIKVELEALLREVQDKDIASTS